MKNHWNGVGAFLGTALVTAFGLALFNPGGTYAQGVISLPQTGQTRCYDAAGAEIGCAGTGQDGEIRAGVPWPEPRFTSGTGDEADCMIDNLTGLMWPKNGNLAGTKTWDAAIDYANDLTLCGHSDWHLPNINELKSLVNAGVPNTSAWLNALGFSDMQWSYYWSATTLGFNTDHAWIVVMWHGSVGPHPKSDSYYVWPVRAHTGPAKIWKTGQIEAYRPGDDGDGERGVAWPNPRFIVQDNCVTDNLTGIMWSKNGSQAGSMTWSDAIDYANDLTLCGHSDWSLPNINELESLVNAGVPNTSAWLNALGFSDVQAGYYWSSTTDAHNAVDAWIVHMWLGPVLANHKSLSRYVWPMRAGQVGHSGNLVISGTARDAITGAALAGVTVTLSNGASTTTDSNGNYSFSSLSAGTYVVTILVSGYVTYYRSVSLGSSNVTINPLLTRGDTAYGGRTFSGYGPDPVNTATGNYIYNKKDMTIPGRGMPFVFERHYNSQDSTDGPLGFGWNHSYNARLTVNGDQSVTIRWGDGKTETWTPDGTGGYRPQYGVFDALSKNPDATYTLTKRDLTRHNFNASGRLASIADRNDNSVTMIYTGSNLTGITDTGGRTIAFAYDGGNHIVNMTDPVGRTLQFTYDLNGNLATAMDMNGNTTTYTYDASHQILTVVDPRGNTVVTNVYDDQKRVVTSQRDAKGGQTTYTYDEANRKTTINDALEGATNHFHDDLLRLIQEQDALGNSAFYTYDASGNRTEVKDKGGNITTYTYDASGNVLTKTDPLGGVTTITYDGNNNPLTRRDALGGTTAFEYDENGNPTKTTNPLGGITRVTYNAHGQPLTITDAGGSVTTSVYDAEGNLTEVTDALGGRTVYTYDGVGRRLTVKDARNGITTYTYDDNGNLLTTTDPAGAIVTHTYDGNGNRLTVTDAKGNLTRYAYDVKDLVTTVTDPLNNTITYTYDALDRKTSARDKRGNITTYGFDAVGNLIQLRTPNSELFAYTYDADGNKLTETNPLGQTTTYAYDALNRISTVTDALGNTTAYTYDALGRMTAKTNANNQTTSFQYDAMGRLTKVTDAAGGLITYTYDANGNRLTITDPNGRVTTYLYDALNRVAKKTEPLGGSYDYGYDAMGNAVSRKDPKGNTIAYGYDGVGRVTSVSYPAGTGVSFAYDLSGNRTGMTDGLGTSTYAYDSLNRMTSCTNPYGKTLGYGYDANGNRTSLTYPDGKVVSYEYDAAGRLTMVRDWFSRAATYAYDGAGRLTGTTNPNGTLAAYAYDSAGRLTGMVNKQADQTVISSYAFTLDAIGNHLTAGQTEPIVPTRQPKTVGYGYDNEGRLTGAGTATFTYDANGNMTGLAIPGSPARTNTFDYNDRLTTSDMGGVSAEYGYDGLGNRLSKTVGGVTTRYVVDVNRQLPAVVAETTQIGTITAYYVHGHGLIARIEPDGTSSVYHYDPRGTTVALTDAGRNVTGAYAYGTFGEVNNTTGAGSQPFRYLGRHGVVDDGNGLYHVRARYYYPEIGRFITKDPLTGQGDDTQTLNRYVYALNNPVRLIDISGFQATEGASGSNYLASSDMRNNYLIDSYDWSDQAYDFSSLAVEGAMAFAKAAFYSAVKTQMHSFQSIRPYVENSPVKALNATGTALTVVSLVTNTWEERKGFVASYDAARGGDYLGAATHLTTSVTAVSVNTVLGGVNAGLRLISDGDSIPGIGQRDLTLTGRDLEESVIAVPEYVGDLFYRWGLY